MPLLRVGNWVRGLAGASRTVHAGRSGNAVVASSLRLSRSVNKPLMLSCIRAFFSGHRFPVASSLNQHQIASLALKSELQPGRFHSRWSALAESGQAPANGVVVSLRGLCADRGGPTLGPEPEGGRTLTLSGRGRQGHAPMLTPRVHFALMEKSVYISQAHHTNSLLTPRQANAVAPKIYPTLVRI